MIVEKIILKNYRCYKSQVIEATKLNLDTNNPGITLFTGDNSVGKTTIFNALGWALYGRETQSILRREPSTLPIPSTSSFDDGGTSEVKVELHMRNTGTINKIVLTRTATFKKNITDPIDYEVTLFLKYSDGTENLSSSKSNREAIGRFLKQLFPMDMASFHLFDGEFLEYTYTNKGENIVKGIRNMFRIFRIEELREAAKELEEKYERDRSKYTNNTKLQNAIKEQTTREKRRDKISTDLEELKTEIKKFNGEITSLNEQIEKLGNVESIRLKLENLKQIEQDIKGADKNLKDAREKKIQLILKNAYLLNSQEIFDEVSRIVEELIEKGKLPQEIKDTFVNDLLEKKICICGTSLAEGSESRNILQNLLKEISGSAEREVLQDMYYSVKIYTNNIKNIRKQVENENGKYAKHMNDKTSLDKNRTNLIGELQGQSSYESLVEKYMELKKTREDNSAEHDRKLLQQGGLQKELVGAEKDIERIKEEIKTFNERDERFQRYESYYKIADKLCVIFSDIISNIISEISERYDKKVNEMIKTIRLLSQFSVKISVSNTDEGKMDFEFLQNGSQKFYMAGGQNQLMGILLIAAFTKVMRESKSEDISAPFVVIDNPVSTLSQDNMIRFGEILNELFGGIHLILFVKNTDFDKIITGAGENISRFYKLSKGQSDEKTLVDEVKLNES